MSGERRRQRLLVFIVAYNAQGTISSVLHRIPHELAVEYEIEVLVIDDCSVDRTFLQSAEVSGNLDFPFKLHVLRNPINQGYGGNQKIGFHFAIEQGFDFVALVHGDGQYAPECLPELVRPLSTREADAVFGSRMLAKAAALRGGMPLYKYVGNQILTAFQNWVLHTNLSEFHTGYRLYSTEALRQVPFELNTNDFHFDTEIIIQLVIAGMRIAELPIPTHYGDEICHVNGLKYAIDVAFTTMQARAQDMSIFYDPKYDCRPPGGAANRYESKVEYTSPDTLALGAIEPGARVLLLGRAGACLVERLRASGCYVTCVDHSPPPDVELEEFVEHDLAHDSPLPVGLERFDWVLLLDLVEHLPSPERFAARLREAARFAPATRLVVVTGNVASVWTRVSLLLGQFNYSKRGILDLTHTRLFTFGTLRRMFEQAGFDVLDARGVPAPFPLALGKGRLSGLLLAINSALIRLSRTLFSYQAFMVVRARPSLAYLLSQARSEARRLLAEEAGDGADGDSPENACTPRRATMRSLTDRESCETLRQ